MTAHFRVGYGCRAVRVIMIRVNIPWLSFTSATSPSSFASTVIIYEDRTKNERT